MRLPRALLNQKTADSILLLYSEPVPKIISGHLSSSLGLRLPHLCIVNKNNDEYAKQKSPFTFSPWFIHDFQLLRPPASGMDASPQTNVRSRNRLKRKTIDRGKNHP